MRSYAENVVRSEAPAIPLVVDLDGTLVTVDTFHQSLLALLKRNVFYLLLLPFWMLKGRAYTKQQVARRSPLEPQLLSFNPEVLQYLQTQHANGRELYLATGANELLAQAIAEHVGIFKEVFASDGVNNLTGERKAALLLLKFGEKGFDYIANSLIDLKIWRHARTAAVVSSSVDSTVYRRALLAAETTEHVAFKKSVEDASFADYVSIARPDHWFKNVFVLPGALLAGFFFQLSLTTPVLTSLFFAVLACCLVASSNYVLNEFLDAERDRHHPVKSQRPLAAGRISEPLAVLEWLLLGAVGIGMGFAVNKYVGGSCLFLWVMGCIYNVPPIRSKELPFLDVLSESINNPIRMAIGWYALGVAVMPPISALFAYWMFGAFLMATKRLAEYRRIGDKQRAAQYRRSFEYYDEERLVVGTIFYVALFMTGSVVFMMLYRLELVLAVPLVSYLLAYYLYLGFRPDSPVQYPERLYKDKNLMLALAVCTAVCLLLFVVDVPAFRDLFVLLPHQQRF